MNYDGRVDSLALPVASWFNRLTGKTRYVVCRIFLHLAGTQVAPLLGLLNQTARRAFDAEGDMEVLGEALVEVCQALLQYDTFWRSAANEGEVFWKEGEAAGFVNELFTDSASRYLSSGDLEDGPRRAEQPLSLPATQNVVVMLTAAYTGEVPDLETDLASDEALKRGLRALINLHYQNQLVAVQVHFSPAQFGDELTEEQLLVNFSELVPL